MELAVSMEQFEKFWNSIPPKERKLVDHPDGWFVVNVVNPKNPLQSLTIRTDNCINDADLNLECQQAIEWFR